MLKSIINWFRKPYRPDPEVRDSGKSGNGTIEILVGHHTIRLSEEQARNLWGELGRVLRVRKAAQAGLMPSKKELMDIGKEWEQRAAEKGMAILQPMQLSEEDKQALLDWADEIDSEVEK